MNFVRLLSSIDVYTRSMLSSCRLTTANHTTHIPLPHLSPQAIPTGVSQPSGVLPDVPDDYATLLILVCVVKNTSSLAFLWFQKWRRRSCSWPPSAPPTSTARTSLSPEGTDDTTPEADRAGPRRNVAVHASLSQSNCVRLLYRRTISTMSILGSRK